MNIKPNDVFIPLSLYYRYLAQVPDAGIPLRNLPSWKREVSIARARNASEPEIFEINQRWIDLEIFDF